MNLPELNRKLLAAARRNTPDDRVPYAFEKRVMARLSAAPKSDPWLAWGRSLWYGAAACAAIALVLNVWSFPSANGEDGDFFRGVEDSLMASVDDLDAW